MIYVVEVVFIVYIYTILLLQTFTGNWDQETVNKHELNPSFEAKYVRVYPKTWHSHVSLRWEIYGCFV